MNKKIYIIVLAICSILTTTLVADECFCLKAKQVMARASAVVITKSPLYIDNHSHRTAQFFAIVEPSDIFSQNVTWAIAPSNKGVSINQDGVVTSNGSAVLGDYDVTATYFNTDGSTTIGHAIARVVDYYKQLISFELNCPPTLLRGESTGDLHPIFNPTDVTDKTLAWSIYPDNTGVSINPLTGNISATASATLGTYTVSATHYDSGITATASILVYDKLKGNGSISGPSTILKNTSDNFTFSFNPTELLSCCTVDWKVNDESIATIDTKTGKVTGKKGGKTIVSATITDPEGTSLTYYHDLEVIAKVEAISFNFTDKLIAGNSASPSNVSVQPDDATDKTLKWTVSPTASGITIDVNTGKLTTTSSATLGYYTITATTTDGSNISASKQVFVYKLFTGNASINGPSSIERGSSTTLTVTTNPAEMLKFSTATWSVSDASIASIDSSTGLIKGLKPGEITVYCTITDPYGNTQTASHKMTITVTLQSISISPTEVYLNVREHSETATLTATLVPADVYPVPTITWKNTTSGSPMTLSSATGNSIVVTIPQSDKEITATIQASANGKSATCKVVGESYINYTYNGNIPNYVELAGYKWATKNVGANTIFDVGSQFGFADNSSSTSFGANALILHIRKTRWGYDQGDTSFDAAAKQWGKPWVVPDTTQAWKLLRGTVQRIKIDGVNTRIEGKRGQKGLVIIVTGAAPDSGQFIFFPKEDDNTTIGFWTNKFSNSPSTARAFTYDYSENKCVGKSVAVTNGYNVRPVYKDW